jgi:glutamine amidotransferase
MCRHLAYLGPPASLRQLIVEPPHGLYRQAWAPRRQRYGSVNADGFGVGWYADDDPIPARYRRGGPIWADPSFADVARVTRTTAAVAAVRCATDGTDAGEAAAAPFSAGPWLFSHNGAVTGWPAAAARLAALLRRRDLVELEARSDSALLWALVLRRLRAGAGPAAALADTVCLLDTERMPGRFNFLLTDGEHVAATAVGDTLCYRRADGHVLVASEPCDDTSGWTSVPDGSVLTAVAGDVRIHPLGPADDPADDPAGWTADRAAGRTAGRPAGSTAGSAAESAADGPAETRADR